MTLEELRLFNAVSNGRVLEAVRIIENGANPEVTNGLGQKPAEVARINGHNRLATRIERMIIQMRTEYCAERVRQMHEDYCW